MVKHSDATEDAAAWRDGTWGRVDERPGPRAGLEVRLARVSGSGRLASASVAAQVFAGNRLILVVVSLLTGWLFGDALGSDHSLAGLWRRWDVLWYISVADHGYVWQPLPHQSNLAFFPLYPLLMHLLTLVSPLSAYGAGLVISSLSFAAALYVLHRLVTRDFGPAVATRAVFYLGLFPTALFFLTAYSEGLYLACTVGCVYALRLRRWWLAGLCGMAAALTRQLGVLLLVPFAVEYWEAATGGPARLDRRRPRPVGLPAGLLIPAGTLAFMAYLQVTLGNALLFLRTQAAWARSLAPPWEGILLSLQHAASPAYRIALRALNGLDLSFLALLLLLLVLGVRRLPRSYTAYAAVLWLAILLNPATGAAQPLALMSVSRFGLTVFPSFITLALVAPHEGVDRLVLSLFVALLSLCTVIFVRGYWIA
jgi:Gpi18-like mannosyltransferase